VSNDNVVKLIQPGILTDRLTEVLRDGARALLTQAVEAEVPEFLAATADLKIDDGCRRVVRHGHLPERQIMEEAASSFAKGSQINPRHSLFPLFRAIALALAGRAEEATSSLKLGLQLEPGFRVRIFFEFGMAPPIAEKFAEGARLLGLPE